VTKVISCQLPLNVENFLSTSRTFTSSRRNVLHGVNYYYGISFNSYTCNIFIYIKYLLFAVIAHVKRGLHVVSEVLVNNVSLFIKISLVWLQSVKLYH